MSLTLTSPPSPPAQDAAQPFAQALAPAPADYRHLYSGYHTIAQGELSPFRSLEHTMTTALQAYVASKLDLDLIARCAASRTPIWVLGVLPAHFEAFAEEWGLTDPVLLNTGLKESARPGRRHNFIRPAVWSASLHGSPLVVVCVPPGRDYLRQYASLYAAALDTHDARRLLQVGYFPSAAEQLLAAAGIDDVLADSLLMPRTKVLLGHVSELEDHLTPALGHFELRSANPYFELRSPADRPELLFLGVNFSFWGDTAYRLGTHLLTRGASELIYVSKVGALSTPDDIYRRLFSPARFSLADQGRIRRPAFEVPSRLRDCLAGHPDLPSASSHVTVPTVMEQGFVHWQGFAGADSPDSIDNEISYLAAATADHNSSTKTSTAPASFTSLAWATDYIRRPSQRSLQTPHDLSTGRTSEALELRAAALTRLAALLGDYLTAA